MEIILFGLLALMLVFMFVNTRKRQKQMKAEQEEKAAKLLPGAKVLLQGGIYGTVVEYDPVDLDKPATIELAPGVNIEVHSQAILRVIDPTQDTDVDPVDNAEDDYAEELNADAKSVETEKPAQNPNDGIEHIQVETPEETKARLERNNEN